MEKKKFYRGPSNVVYEIDGACYGLDDGLVEAIKSSIGRRLAANELEIPRLPQVANRILKLSETSDPDNREVVRTISTDPLLATRIMAIANSAAYAGLERLDGLEPVLMRLGFKAVRDIVFAESLRMRVFSARGYRPLLEASWQVSIGTAVACEALSKSTGLERDRAFLLGLLHETGVPVLAGAVAEIEKANRGNSLGSELVEILLSTMHEETGGYVLGRWGMSEAFVGAAREHHHYRGVGQSTSAQRLVYAGNLICEHLGIGRPERSVDFTLEHAFADLGLADLTLMSPILDAVQEGVDAMIVVADKDA